MHPILSENSSRLEGVNTGGKISVIKYANNIILLGESSNNLKQLMKVKKYSAKMGQHQKAKIMK